MVVKSCGDELSGQFNIKSFLACTTGPQTGGWFAREVVSPESFKGLRYRMTGPGAEVLRRMGATLVVVPGGQIVESLKSGAIDGSEFAGPWLDTWLGGAVLGAAGWKHHRVHSVWPVSVDRAVLGAVELHGWFVAYSGKGGGLKKLNDSRSLGWISPP